MCGACNFQRGFELHEVGGAEARLRWAAARARHHPDGRDDKGCADGTVQALEAARKQLIMCGVCGALVQLQAARRLARKAGRSRIADGDGCSSSTCTTSHAQPHRFARGQEERAAGLLSGSHSLVLPPPTTGARTHLWVAPAHLPRAVALAITAPAPTAPAAPAPAVPPPTCPARSPPLTGTLSPP